MTFRDISRQTWNQLRDCRKVGHQLLEETVTDLHSLFLKTNHPSDIQVVNYNKRHEALNGSDWLWVFIDPHSRTWLKVRVQAKIINLASDKYLKLHYASGGMAQHTKLENASRMDGSVPLYVFYSHWKGYSKRSGHLLSSPSPNNWKRYGCSIATLPAVKNLNGSKNVSDVRKIVMPWDFLVCPHASGGGPLPVRVGKALSRLHRTPETQTEEWHFNPQPIDRVPSYLLEPLLALGVADVSSEDESGIDESLAGFILFRDSRPATDPFYQLGLEQGREEGYEKGFEEGRKDAYESFGEDEADRD